jgi:hypothetical protein
MFPEAGCPRQRTPTEMAVHNFRSAFALAPRKRDNAVISVRGKDKLRTHGRTLSA